MSPLTLTLWDRLTYLASFINSPGVSTFGSRETLLDFTVSLCMWLAGCVRSMETGGYSLLMGEVIMLLLAKRFPPPSPSGVFLAAVLVPTAHCFK